MAHITANTVAGGRRHVEKYLLPSLCKIYPRQAQSGVNEYGLPAFGALTPRTWRGVEDIPCRLEESRAFIPDRLKSQVADVNSFVLEIPFDAPLENEDRVLVSGTYYEVAKLAKAENLDVSTVAILRELTADVDVTI